jgi:hypothetical protein
VKVAANAQLLKLDLSRAAGCTRADERVIRWMVEVTDEADVGAKLPGEERLRIPSAGIAGNGPCADNRSPTVTIRLAANMIARRMRRIYTGAVTESVL